ncbi:hypothetical protein DY000_02030643 [Brassica cretica]|uniref:Uncharacterized protein n=1 Tax=Brassica cretica TaxID=69181 RepID=A0ABQ7DGY6_BRACR|nr:hypothetical protein DY000_02030643 [Brassica cretica]
MEGSPYRKFSISQRNGGSPETEPGKLPSGEPGFLPAGILETGFAPYCSISSSNSGNNVHSSQPELLILNRGLVLFRPLIVVEDGELWASDDVLETVEPGALMFPEEELGNSYDETSEFLPSRGVVLVARENLPRGYYPYFCFLPPSGFPTFLLSLCGLHSLKLNSPFSGIISFSLSLFSRSLSSRFSP